MKLISRPQGHLLPAEAILAGVCAQIPHTGKSDKWDGFYDVSTKKMTNVCELTAEEARAAFAMISGKWKLEILWLLNQRIHRFGELKRGIPGITQHMLTLQLRELEADKLISRQVFAEVPPRVEYALTPAAYELAPVFDGLFAWWKRHNARSVGLQAAPGADVHRKDQAFA